MTKRPTWNQIRGRRLTGAIAREAYARAKQANELGAKVRLRREEAGLSQRELAERIGTTQSAIARLESGGVLPTIATLARIADALGNDLKVELQPRTKRPA